MRQAAALAWRSLASVVNRLCDASLAPPSQARAVLELMLPPLLEKGITHATDDVTTNPA